MPGKPAAKQTKKKAASTKKRATTASEPRRRGGRKSKLTPDVQRKLCEALRTGATRKAAAGMAGIGESTLRAWMADGSKAAFQAAIEAAEANGEQVFESVVYRIARGLPASEKAEDPPKAADSLRAALAVLAKRYGWVDRTEVTGAGGGPVQVRAVDATLPDDQADGRDAIDALAERLQDSE